jgi:hypothetical protein
MALEKAVVLSQDRLFDERTVNGDTGQEDIISFILNMEIAQA